MDQNKYEQCKAWLERSEKAIQGRGGFFKAPKEWVSKYQEIAEKVLAYEIKNDLIPVLL